VNSSRARANQALYHASILIDSWHAGLEAGVHPAMVVNQAFLPAVHAHLNAAYGWFLLQVSGEESWDGAPPASTAQLPPVPQGRAVSAEVREFRQLEKDGWIGGFLQALSNAPGRTGSRGEAGLSLMSVDEPGCDVALAWKQDFEVLFERMSNAIDEC